MLVVRDFTGNVFQPTALEGPQDLSQWGSFNLDFLQEAVGALTHDDEFSPSSSSSFPHEVAPKPRSNFMPFSSRLEFLRALPLSPL